MSGTHRERLENRVPARRWPGDKHRLLLQDAGGSRTHFGLLCRQPPCRLAPASFFFSVLARNRTWSTTIAGSRADPAHSKDKQSRRLDSHQHEPAYEAGAFLCRATSAKHVRSRSERTTRARARGFGPREPVLEAGGSPRSTLVCCFQQGYPMGVEPMPPGSQPGVQRPLHHGNHVSCSSSTRSRTRTSSFEARNDFRFTIELKCGNYN